MLCVFIDAWNPAYMRHMKFLSSIRKECLSGSLEVPFGYTSIIASFVTGNYPDKHKVFDLFVPDPQKERKIKNAYLWAAWRLLQDKRFFYTPLRVPGADYFKVSMDKAWPQRQSLPLETMYDLFEKNRKSFEVIDWPNHFRNRQGSIFLSKKYPEALQRAQKSKADFTFVHFLDLDTIAHHHGVSSPKTIEAVKRIDEACRELYEMDENILFFSDHGMNDILKEVNIIAEIKKLNLKFGRDFLYIVGATTVEFWFNNTKARQKVTELLKGLPYGKIIDKRSFRIETDSDIIFLADFQTGFYPNFFSKNHYAAMHGWNPKVQKTYYMLKNPVKRGKKDAQIVDFLPTILKLMKLPAKKYDGKSLI